jgi:hypothetical protein
MRNFNEMTLSQKRKVLASTGLPMAALVLIVGFQNCSPGLVQSSKLDSNGSSGNTVLNIEEDTKPVSTVNSENLLVSMQSLAGIETISDRTVAAAVGAKSKVSETGKVDSINGPMWLSLTNLAGEVCLDLITEEKAKAQADRRFFGQVNFNAPPSSMTPEVRDDVIRRMARNFWGRNETPPERTVIKSSLDEAIALPRRTGVSDALETEDALIYTCTAMLSSLDSMKF